MLKNLNSTYEIDVYLYEVCALLENCFCLAYFQTWQQQCKLQLHWHIKTILKFEAQKFQIRQHNMVFRFTVI